MRTQKFWLAILLILALPLQGLALAGSCAKHHRPQPVHSQAQPIHDCEGHHTASAQHNTQTMNLLSADGTCSACAFCHAGHSMLAATATIGSAPARAEHIAYATANCLSPAAAVLDPPPKSWTL
jgi:hypothetical protein